MMKSAWHRRYRCIVVAFPVYSAVTQDPSVDNGPEFIDPLVQYKVYAYTKVDSRSRSVSEEIMHFPLTAPAKPSTDALNKQFYVCIVALYSGRLKLEG